MKDETQSEALLTAREVASLLRIRPSTVYQAVAERRLPAIELWRGRRKPLLRFRRADIEELIRRGHPVTDLKG